MIGILGGSFNPIHNGHIQLAQQVLESLALDELHFLPCANPVHRNALQVSGVDRLNMVKLAIAQQQGFIANTLELDRGGASYMVDTLQQMREQYTQMSIGLILGADAFNNMLSWKQSSELLNLAHVIVCQRPNVEINYDIFSDHWVNSIATLKQQKSGRILSLAINQNSCSATMVRKQLQKSESTASCLPIAVLEYILNHHLYENSCE